MKIHFILNHPPYGTEIFESGIENCKEIEAIAVSVLWMDGAVTTGWPNTDVPNVALMIPALGEGQRRKHL